MIEHQSQLPFFISGSTRMVREALALKEEKGKVFKMLFFKSDFFSSRSLHKAFAVCRDLELKKSDFKKYCVKKVGLHTQAKLMQSQKLGLFSLDSV